MRFKNWCDLHMFLHLLALSTTLPFYDTLHPHTFLFIILKDKSPNPYDNNPKKVRRAFLSK